MNYPKTVDELIRWDTYTDKDSFGKFTAITGYEGKGCFWCGRPLEGRRRYCKDRECYDKYQEHFGWVEASKLAANTSGNRCQNCGIPEIDIPMITSQWSERSGLEVHHIIPLNGAQRVMSVFNIWWNLIALCHKCHMELHAILRGDEYIKATDPFILAEARGQKIFNMESP